MAKTLSYKKFKMEKVNKSYVAKFLLIAYVTNSEAMLHVQN